VLLLGIFRSVPRHAATKGRPCALLIPKGLLLKKNNIFFFSFSLAIYDTSSTHQGAIY
jgi:hypothetical protein